MSKKDLMLEIVIYTHENTDNAKCFITLKIVKQKTKQFRHWIF